MRLNDYKLRIGTENRAIFYKHYDENINQVIVYYIKTTQARALVELRTSDIYVSQALLDEMQIALNRTKKDCVEKIDYFKEKIVWAD